MTTSNISRWLSATTVVLLLAACQGQNPVKSSDDIAKDYPNAAKVNAPADVDQGPLPEEVDNTQLLCRDPFIVDVDGDAGSLALVFTEEKQQDYTIRVRNRFGDAFDTSWKAPAGLELVEKGDGLFALSWTPAKSKFDQKPEVLDMTFSSPKSEKCGGGHVGINLIVYRTRKVPTVTFAGLPTGHVNFGDSVKFHVMVNDPGATGEETPTLSRPFIRKEAITSQNGKVDGSAAADCTQENPALAKEHGYIFDCTFHSSALKEVRSGKKVDAVFYVQATSSRTGQQSPATPAYISVQFGGDNTPVAKTVEEEWSGDTVASDDSEIDTPKYGPTAEQKPKKKKN